jgi:orotate phosphoribosyltransferase
MRDVLFQQKCFKMHSGGIAQYKIECNALTDEDLNTLAWIVAQKTRQLTWHNGSGIKSVYGIPYGGVRLADALEKYIDPKGSLDLIVDDVLTTGKSMELAKEQGKGSVGVVIFARGPCPSWVKPIFQMIWFNTQDEF